MLKLSGLTRRRAGLTKCLLSSVILSLLLTGCDEVTFRYLCPQLKKYSPEFQNKVADEMKVAGPNIRMLVSDYGQLRDACRAMEKK